MALPSPAGHLDVAQYLIHAFGGVAAHARYPVEQQAVTPTVPTADKLLASIKERSMLTSVRTLADAQSLIPITD